MKILSRLGKGFAAVVMSAVASSATAAVTLCDNSNPLSGYVDVASNNGLFGKENVTLNGVMATNCYGHASVPGNSPASVVSFANSNSLFGGSWSAAARINADGSGSTSFSVGGLTFSITNITQGTTGTFNLVISDDNVGTAPDLPAEADFFLTLKSSTLTDFYFFDDRAVNALNPGTYTVAIINQNGQQQNLSDITVGVRDIRDNGNGNGGGGGGSAPEPATVGLIGLGMLAIGALRRRKVVVKD